jgi:hypothetical protein
MVRSNIKTTATRGGTQVVSRRLLGDCHDAVYRGVDRVVVRKDALGPEGIAPRPCSPRQIQRLPAIRHPIPEGHGMRDVVVVRPGDCRPDRHFDISGLVFCRNRDRDMGDADNGRGSRCGWCCYRCIASTTAREQHDTDEEKYDETQRVSLDMDHTHMDFQTVTRAAASLPPHLAVPGSDPFRLPMRQSGHAMKTRA